MKKHARAIVVGLLLGGLLVGCGGNESPSTTATGATADYLPTAWEGTDITRSSEVGTFVGEALYEHINGG
ncbi:MAG: hypothetical protein KKA42_15530, partial [candidate division Zixibacteria bacterium]|nr:hypothetical protein [candidate division Zixibacteria bacterium]